MFAALIFVLAPRGAEGEAPTLRLQLQQALRLDQGAVLRAGSYELAWTGRELVAVTTTTRQEALRVPAIAKAMPIGAQTATLTVDQKTQRATLTVRLEKQEVVLLGTLVQQADQSLAGLGDNGGPVSLPASAQSESSDPVSSMWRERLRPQVAHCADKAQKQLWPVPKYEKCVCPLVLKFHLPPLAGARNLPLDARTLVAVDVDAKGNVKTCALRAL